MPAYSIPFCVRILALLGTRREKALQPSTPLYHARRVLIPEVRWIPLASCVFFSPPPFSLASSPTLSLRRSARIFLALSLSLSLLGIVSGAITAGFGTGALLFSPLQTSFLNPSNVPPSSSPYLEQPTELYYNGERDEELAILMKVPPLLTRLSICYFLLIAAGAALLRPPQASLHAGGEVSSASSFSTSSVHTPQHGVGKSKIHEEPGEQMTMSVGDALQSTPFWCLWILFFFNGLAICFTATFWRLLAVDTTTRMYILSEKQLALVGAVASACNALGRLFWGHIADKKGFQTSLVRNTVYIHLDLFKSVSKAVFGFALPIESTITWNDPVKRRNTLERLHL